MKKEVSKKRALNTSIKEGSAAGISTGISNTFITPFALKLSSNEFYIGFLSALAGIVSPLSQFIGSHWMKRQSRKKIVLMAVFWQAILWIPLVLLGILKFLDIYPNILIFLLIFFYTLIIAFSGILYPPWFSWIGDLVEDKHKGRYFARRNTITGIYELVSVIIGGIILRYSENWQWALLSFSFIFFISFIFRLVSLTLMAKMEIDEEVTIVKSHNEIKNILKHKKEFMKFSWYNLLLNFAIFFASPFFAVYMINQLKFDYLTFTIVSLSGGIYYLIFNKMIGKFSDKYGNTRLLILANICFALNPLLWTLSTSPIYLIFVPGLFTGIANSALILSVNNFSLDALNKKERGDGISIINLFSGIGIFIGSVLGGFVLEKSIGLLGFNKFIILFIIAFIFRAAVAIIFVPMLKEVKKVSSLPHVHISLLHPFKSIHAERMWIKHVFR